MIRIVLADDHQFLRAGVEAALRAEGMEVVASVEDGEAALAAIRREQPDLAILDLRMPLRSGAAVLQAMRAEGDQCPVILLAAEVEDAALRTAMQAGINGIVYKAGAETTLPQAIRTVLSGELFIDDETARRADALARSTPPKPVRSLLTAREIQIAEAVAEGLRNREIGGRVGMTEGSIKVYLHRIYEKLAIESRTELAVLMIEQDRLNPPEE